MKMLKDFTNKGLGQWSYFLIHIVLAVLLIIVVDHLKDFFILFVLSVVAGYIFSLKRVNDTKFASIHSGYKYLISLLCSIPFLSLPFALVLTLFPPIPPKYEKPLTAFEEKYAESEFLKKLISVNQIVGVVSIPLWALLSLPIGMACGSGDCNNFESAVQISLLSYPLVAIFTTVMTKWIKFRTKIPVTIISFLYWWFLFFFILLLVFILE